jgi:dienelactone hydrolase
MLKKESNPESKEASKDVLSRRTAIKRIAAGLATAGVVVVAGNIFQERPKPPYGDSAAPPYGDAAR